MNNYELTIVLPEKSTPAKKKSAQELIAKLVKTFKGKIAKVDDWGRLDLSYPIEKNDSGEFLHFHLELEADGPKNLSDKLNLETGIIRYLIVAREDKK